MTLIALLSIAALALARLLLLLRPVRSARADEEVYRGVAELIAESGWRTFRKLGPVFAGSTDPNVTWKPPPQRVVYFVLSALLFRFTKRHGRVQAGISTGSAVLIVACGGAIGWHLGGPAGGVAAAALVGSAPLLLGLGRRALLDVPACAAQTLVVASALAGPAWWPLVSAAVAFALLTRESIRSSLPGLLVAVAWLWWWNWSTAVMALAAGLPVYAVGLRWVTSLWPWQYQIAFMHRVVGPAAHWVAGALGGRLPRIQGLLRRIPSNPVPAGHYARQYCRGGLHRLLVDLVMLSPGVVLVAALRCPQNGLVLASVAVVAGYAVPWLDQQVRSCMVGEVLLRVAVALAVPWWGVLLLVAFDLYVYWRVWWRSWGKDGKQFYDPTQTNIGRALGMVGP